MTITRIMLVEDEAIAALCIRTSLEKLGYEVPATVARGAEAIRLAAEIGPDLILMDITLADDVTGIEAAEAIRKAQQIPIIFMTAHVDAETVARAKRAEPFGYLTKPFNPDSLKHTIEVALFKSAADAKVRESERSYRLLAENATDMISRHAPDGTFLFASPSFFDGIGHEPQGLVGRQVYDYIHPADVPAIRRALASVSAGSSIATVSYRFRHRDGGYRWMEAKAKTLRDPSRGEIQEFIVSTRDISDRKEAEQRLTEQAAFLQTLLDTVPAPIYYKDANGAYLGCNAAFEHCLAKPRNEVIGKTVFDLFPPDLATVCHQFDLKLLRDRGTQSYETQVPFADGILHDVVFSKTVYRRENDQPDGLIGAMIDLTELKRREAMTLQLARGISSRVGDDFFRALTRNLAQLLGAEHAFVGALEGDEINVIAGLSNGVEIGAMCRPLAGTPCEQVLSSGEICLFAQGVQDRFPANQLLQSMEAEGYAGSALRDAGGTPLGIMAVLFVRPIDDLPLTESLLQIFAARAAAELERRRTEQTLLESEARYKKLFHEFETIFNAIPDSLTLWSPELHLLWANQGTRDHYLRKVPELLGKPCIKVCAVCHDEECEVKRCFRSQVLEDGLKKTRDGRTWGIKAFPLKDDSGAVIQVIRLASDLTERMHLREETARAAHLAALGELAAGVAHEINNPAGLILLEMPILRDAFRDAEPILEEHFRSRGDFRFAGLNYSEVRGQLAPMIEEITEGAQRIKQIVQELKDFSRPAEGNPFAVVDLNEVVRKANSLVSGKIRNLTDACSVVLCEEPVTVMGNFQKLEQVVINLLVNAAQALTERTGLVEVRVLAARQRGWGVVTVRDEGVGIRPEHLPVITDPFFTTRREVGGTGLGLSVSMRIVQDHGGSLFFDSEPGRGTLVTLELPLHKEVRA